MIRKFGVNDLITLMSLSLVNIMSLVNVCLSAFIEEDKRKLTQLLTQAFLLRFIFPCSCMLC